MSIISPQSWRKRKTLETQVPFSNVVLLVISVHWAYVFYVFHLSCYRPSVSRAARPVKVLPINNVSFKFPDISFLLISRVLILSCRWLTLYHPLYTWEWCEVFFEFYFLTLFRPILPVAFDILLLHVFAGLEMGCTFIHLFHTFEGLLCGSNILGFEGAAVNKTDKNLCPRGAYIPWEGERNNERNIRVISPLGKREVQLRDGQCWKEG